MIFKLSWIARLCRQRMLRPQNLWRKLSHLKFATHFSFESFPLYGIIGFPCMQKPECMSSVGFAWYGLSFIWKSGEIEFLVHLVCINRRLSGCREFCGVRSWQNGTRCGMVRVLWCHSNLVGCWGFHPYMHLFSFSLFLLPFFFGIAV